MHKVEEGNMGESCTRPAAVGVFFPIPSVTQFQLPASPRSVAQFITSPLSPAWPSLAGRAMA